MSEEPAPYFVEWSRGFFAMMAEGGIWGVPRSGLMFRKRGNTLTLYDRMPHHPDMPISKEELREQQDADYEIIKFHFEAAGVEVRSEIG